MATKTFSSRADEHQIALADALTRQEYGLSFGQYCGSVLLSYIQETGKLPPLENDAGAAKTKREALSFIRGFSAYVTHPEIGRLTDDEIANLIGQRYA